MFPGGNLKPGSQLCSISFSAISINREPPLSRELGKTRSRNKSERHRGSASLVRFGTLTPWLCSLLREMTQGSCETLRPACIYILGLSLLCRQEDFRPEVCSLKGIVAGTGEWLERGCMIHSKVDETQRWRPGGCSVGNISKQAQGSPGPILLPF